MTVLDAGRTRPRDCSYPHDDPGGCPVCGWDGAHRYLDAHCLGGCRRAACSCGWLGRVRRGADAGWQAVADYDEHVNSS